ncbi:MAG: ABC transporter permease [Sphingobacteriales bacterium]|jgi:lipopolysaccharide transport system permease protein
MRIHSPQSTQVMHSKSNLQRIWDWEINAQKSSWNWNLKSILSYRHLLFRMVRKEFLVNYQQTVLGPIWIFVQPLLTLLTYVLVFGKLIRVPTASGSPPVLFYLAGIILWNFFNEGFLLISRTFRENIHIFSKVYFPRVIIPLSVLLTQFLRFLIQMVLLLLMMAYYFWFQDDHSSISFNLWFLPFSIFVCGMLSFGTGLIFSVFTGKYRDIVNIVEVGVRLLFFVTPVVYPLSIIPSDMHWLVKLNPLTAVFESFRMALLGSGQVTGNDLAYSFLLATLVLFFSVYIFNREGSRLIDIV